MPSLQWYCLSPLASSLCIHGVSYFNSTVCLLSPHHYASMVSLTSTVLSVSSRLITMHPWRLILQQYCLSPLASSLCIHSVSYFNSTVYLLSPPHYASMVSLTSTVLSVSSCLLTMHPWCLLLQQYCLFPLASSLCIHGVSYFNSTVYLLSPPHYASTVSLTSTVLSVSSRLLTMHPWCLLLQQHCLSPLASSLCIHGVSYFNSTVCLLSPPHYASIVSLTSTVLSISSRLLTMHPWRLLLQQYCLSPLASSLCINGVSYFNRTVCLLSAPSLCVSFQSYVYSVCDATSFLSQPLYHSLQPGLEVIKLEFIFRLKIKRNDWLLADTRPQAANYCALYRLKIKRNDWLLVDMIGCLWTRVHKQPIIAFNFESENDLKFYNLDASSSFSTFATQSRSCLLIPYTMPGLLFQEYCYYSHGVISLAKTPYQSYRQVFCT